MAYKPQNVAKYRDDSSTYPKGSSTGKGGGVVPGTTGSDDRGSQLKDFIGEGQAYGSGDYNILPTNNLDSRTKDNFGKSSYTYKQPTL